MSPRPFRRDNFPDVISLLEEGDMNMAQLKKSLNLKLASVTTTLNHLRKKGIVRRGIIHNNASITYYLEKHYLWYRVISCLDNTICPRLIDERGADLSKQYESVLPYVEIDFIIKLFQNAASVTIITDRKKKYENVTREWIINNLGISKFSLVFVKKENKIDTIKTLYNGLEQLFYNIYLDKDATMTKELNRFDDQYKIQYKIENDPIITNYYGLLHAFNLKKELPLLSVIYDTYLSIKFSKPI